MNPTRVFARNYRTYDHVDVELPAGCTAIVGENGAGKSSLINLIELALFGPRSRSLADHLGQASGETEMEVGCELEHAGEVYRVRRAYSARGARGVTKLDFETLAEHMAYDHGNGDRPPDEYIALAWEPLTQETAKATQALIEETLGLSRETFRASAFLAQGDAAAFTEAEPRARKQILTEILGLHVYDLLLERARADRAGLETELSKIIGRLELADAELAGKPAVVAERDSHAVEKEHADQGLEQATAAYAGAAAALADAREKTAGLTGAREVLATRERALVDAAAQVDRLNGEHEQIQEDISGRADLAEIAATAPAIEAELEQARDQHERWAGQIVNRDAARTEVDRVIARQDELDGQLAQSKHEREQAEAELARVEGREEALCPTCGQGVEGAARARTLEQLRKAPAQLDVVIAKLEIELEKTVAQLESARAAAAVAIPVLPDLRALDERIRRARDAQAKIAALDEKQRRLDQIVQDSDRLIESFVELEHARDQAREEVARLTPTVDVDELAQTAQRATERVTAAQAHVANLDRLIAACDSRLERVTEIERASEADRQRKTGLEVQVAVVTVLERAFGRDGIPALILENAAIPQIELEANRILTELGTGYRVELRTQRALKTADGVREALDITVAHAGRERPYETFSGGERTRINLALRIALARLLAHRRGAQVRILCLDEPDALDDHGMEALTRILRGLTSDFDRVLLISHQPTLRDAFDQVLTVQKDEAGRSRIVEADDREAVPA